MAMHFGFGSGGIFDELYRQMMPITINFLVKPVDLRAKQVVGPAAEATIMIDGVKISKIGITIFQSPGESDQVRIVWPGNVKFSNQSTELLWERRVAEAFVRAYQDKTPGPQGLFDQAATRALPWKALGLDGPADEVKAKAAYRKAALRAHPDRGGSDKQMATINGAWDTICKAMHW